ncbi:MAG: TonB-dependent receptor [Thermoanaerobaculia bacterium]|nr:TonB-dependent receptor [Thermoanaerobaculia bacterium]
MSRSNFWRLGLAVVGLLLVVSPVFGQAQQGNLYGTVTDEEGAALPGVTVTLTGIGAPRVQVTNQDGEFRFLNLDPGNYQIVAELEGFSTVEFPNVNIRVNRNTTIEIEMSSAIEEVITVTSESPLLDERKVATGTTVSQVELEKIPTARDPWAIVNQTPGVLTDRLNIGGNQSGQQAVFKAPGVTDDENSFAVDGVVITDMAAIGSSPTYYDFDQFEEMQISTGGSDVEKISAGASLNLVTKRGTNTPRGSARFLLTDGATNFDIFEPGDPDIDQSEFAEGQTALVGNEINEVLDFGFEAGGPVVRDNLWIWGSYGRNDIKQFAAGGTPDNTLLENTAIKVNAQPITSNSLVASWNRGDKIKDGRGAGPSRSAESTWDQDGPSEIWKAEDTHVFTSSFYLTGMISYVDGGFQLQPKGGAFNTNFDVTSADVALANGEPYLDEGGVWQNGYIGGVSDRNTDTYQVDGSYFFNTGDLNHELKMGAHYRTFDVESAFGWAGGRGLVSLTCESIGTCGLSDALGGFIAGDELLGAWGTSVSPVEQTYTALWVQDTLTFGSLTINGGLRYDLQDGEIVSGTRFANPVFPDVLPRLDFQGLDPEFEWETISPRLGVTYALGAERKTLLRASYSRFAEQLSTANVTPVNPVGDAFPYFWYTDSNDNNVFDQGEPVGLDPFGPPASAFNSLSGVVTEIDAGLDAPTTDELLFGVEHALLPEFVVGAEVRYRLISDIIESQGFVLDNGVQRLTQPGDYVPAFSGGPTLCSGQTDEGGSVAPFLPNGNQWCADYYVLDPNLSPAGGGFITNGDREREYLGASITFTKRLANRWMARGYVNYGETEWDVPASYTDPALAVFNPTNAVAGGDKDGELFMVQSAGSGNFDNVYLSSTWSANLNGMYQVAPDRPWGFNVAANIYAREGYPIPYSYTADTIRGTQTAQVVPDGDSFRNEDLVNVDLRLEKDMPFSDNLSGTLSLDVFNLFDETTTLQRENSLSGARPNFLEETLAPRIYRLGFRLNWR